MGRISYTVKLQKFETLLSEMNIYFYKEITSFLFTFSHLKKPNKQQEVFRLPEQTNKIRTEELIPTIQKQLMCAEILIRNFL